VLEILIPQPNPQCPMLTRFTLAIVSGVSSPVWLFQWFMGRTSPSCLLPWRLGPSCWIACRLGPDLHLFNLQPWTQFTAVFQSETTGKEEEERQVFFS